MADGCHLGLRPALHRGGVQGLLLQPLAQRVAGLQADHAVELRPVARDEAYPADHHVVDRPASVAHVQAVVERDLRAPPGHHLRAHGGEVPLYRLADEADPLAAARLDLRHVGALQEVPEERHELRLLAAAARPAGADADGSRWPAASRARRTWARCPG